MEKRNFVMRELRMKETEGEEESRVLEGYAAIFNSRSENLGWFYEEIAEGAFDGVLEVSDVRALFNHNPDLILGRSTAGTLRLSVDKTGLRYEIDLPNTRAADELIELIQRGDINQSSFAFTVKRQSWIEEKDENDNWKDIRRIEEFDRLYDVSPVTYPAYADTSVAKRSYDQHKSTQTTQDFELEQEQRERKLRMLKLTL